MFKEYIEENLNKLHSKKEKVKYLNKVILDGWAGMSFEFQSNAMGMKEEAKFQLKELNK